MLTRWGCCAVFIYRSISVIICNKTQIFFLLFFKDFLKIEYYPVNIYESQNDKNTRDYKISWTKCFSCSKQTTTGPIIVHLENAWAFAMQHEWYIFPFSCPNFKRFGTSNELCIKKILKQKCNIAMPWSIYTSALETNDKGILANKR